MPHALLDQPVKELPPEGRVPAIKAESEFVEIVFKLFGGCTALEGAEQPSLKQRRDAVDSWQLCTTSAGQSSMPITQVFQPAIGPLPVAADPRTHNDIFLHKVDNRGAVVVRKFGDPDSTYSVTANFSSNYHDILCSFRRISRPQSADHGLVHLDFAGELFTCRSDHSSTQFVQHRPCRLITGKSEKPLKSQRIDPRFLVRRPPDSPVPQPQRNPASVKNSSSCEVDVCSAALAMEHPLLGAPGLPCFTPWADKSFGPANPFEVVPT